MRATLRSFCSDPGALLFFQKQLSFQLVQPFQFFAFSITAATKLTKLLTVLECAPTDCCGHQTEAFSQTFYFL